MLSRSHCHTGVCQLWWSPGRWICEQPPVCSCWWWWLFFLGKPIHQIRSRRSHFQGVPTATSSASKISLLMDSETLVLAVRLVWTACHLIWCVRRSLPRGAKGVLQEYSKEYWGCQKENIVSAVNRPVWKPHCDSGQMCLARSSGNSNTKWVLHFTSNEEKTS